MTPDTALSFEAFDATSMTDAENGLATSLLRMSPPSFRLRLKPGERIAQQGGTAEHIFRVVTGCVRLCRHLAGGRRPIADFLFAGDFWGLGESSCYQFSAEAVSPVSLIAYRRAAFEQSVAGNEDLSRALSRHLTAALARAQAQILLLNCQSARERVAAFLLRLADPHSDESRVSLPMSRHDIADHLGLSVETVCRALTHMRKAGIIEIANPQLIVIRKSSALRSVAEGNALSH